MIKSEVIKTYTRIDKPFPKLMKTCRDLYVYFYNPERGVVVKEGGSECYGILHMESDWCMDQFSDTDDTIKLTIGGN